MPKNPAKREIRRKELKQAGEYKRQVDSWQSGSRGAAGPVRRINPAEYTAEKSITGDKPR